MPLSSSIRGGAALLVVVAIIAGGATGLARYVASHGHESETLAALGRTAKAAAAAANAGALKDAVAAAPDAAAVSVVAAGETDRFGLAREATIVADEVRDPAYRDPAIDEAAELIDHSSTVEGIVEDEGAGSLTTRQKFAVVQRGAETWLLAHAPIVAADGTYRGLVRIGARRTSAPDPVPWWRLLGGLLLGALVFGLWLSGGRGSERLVAGTVAALAGAGIVVGAGLGFATWTGLIAGLCAAFFTGPTADLIRGLREQPKTYLYVVPAVVAMVLLVFVPFGMGVALAFFDSAGDPVGLANFDEILFPTNTADTNFYWTLFITIVWTASNVIFHLAIGLALALVLNRPNLKFRGLYRVLLIVPWAVPNYITALIWKWMFNTQYGAVNAFLALFGIDRIDWLGDSVLTNFLANLTTNVWLGFPFMMVVSLGALQSIPKDLYEAARIDGATRVQAFRHVTMPLLKPALVPAIILGSIWTFNMFNVIYLVSGGAPDGLTNILITEAYDAFKVLKRYGFAAAYSLLIFVILYAYGQLTDRITRASEGAYE